MNTRRYFTQRDQRASSRIVTKPFRKGLMPDKLSLNYWQRFLPAYRRVEVKPSAIDRNDKKLLIIAGGVLLLLLVTK